MRSYQACSREIDDLELAVAEIAAQLQDKPLLKNTCALVFCGFELDMGELAARLEQALQVPFIGCSTLGMLVSNGYMESSISVLLLTADDCEFSAAMSEPIRQREDLPRLREAYRRASYPLQEEVKLILAYTPWLMELEHDAIVETLDEESAGVPVFGGIASDGWNLADNSVLCNGQVSRDQVVLLLISGNVQPLTSIEHSSSFASEELKVVTKADRTVVYEFNDRPVSEYIQETGLLTDKPSGPWDYLGTPFFTTKKTKDGDEIELMRCVGAIDMENKCCRFIGSVEVGNEMNMVLISKADIEVSAHKAVDSILQRINEAVDYQYSVIMMSSCAARYSLIVADKDTEVRGYAGRLPAGVNMHGAYVFGEFCPAKGKKKGKLHNVLSNETLTLLAF